MIKNKKIINLFLLLVLFSSIKAYELEDIPENLDKEWYCNIVKGNAIDNYFALPSVEEGLKIKRADYETSADFDDALEYYNLENYRITLNFKANSKATIGWTSLLYNNKYEGNQHIKKTYTYQLNGNQGAFTSKGEFYPFSIDNQVIAIPSQNVVCYADLAEAQKNYNLYELNENFDKKMADDDGFVISDSVLRKYIGTKRKLILPNNISEVANFDSDNVYYFSSLVIPQNVKKIDDKAFQYLNADELVLEDGVLEIGNEAFLDADFVDIYLPASITKIGTKAFGNKIIEKPTFHVVNGSFADNYLKNNYGQTDINIEYDYDKKSLIVNDCQQYVNYTYKQVKDFINSDGFAIKNGTLYACNKEKSTVTVPNEVTKIASEAFSDYYNSKVKTIIVPKNVKTVEYSSFSYTSAKTIIFDIGLEKIESHAFLNVYAKDIYLPPTIKKIGKNIFNTEKGLKGTVFHVEKDSDIAKYLEENPPEGEFEIAYDYDKASSIIANEGHIDIKYFLVAGILVLIVVVVLVIRKLKCNKKEARAKELLKKKRAQRIKKLRKNIAKADNVSSTMDKVPVENNLSDSSSEEESLEKTNSYFTPQIISSNDYDAYVTEGEEEPINEVKSDAPYEEKGFENDALTDIKEEATKETISEEANENTIGNYDLVDNYDTNQVTNEEVSLEDSESKEENVTNRDFDNIPSYGYDNAVSDSSVDLADDYSQNNLMNTSSYNQDNLTNTNSYSQSELADTNSYSQSELADTNSYNQDDLLDTSSYNQDNLLDTNNYQEEVSNSSDTEKTNINENTSSLDNTKTNFQEINNIVDLIEQNAKMNSDSKEDNTLEDNSLESEDEEALREDEEVI